MKKREIRKMIRECVIELMEDSPKRYKSVVVKLQNGKEVFISGRVFQKGTVPDPHTSQLLILKALKMMGHNAVKYTVIEKKK